MTNVDLWNSRSHLGPAAGTGDLIAAELERRYIAKHIRRGMRMLDVGCGNGTTIRWMARHAHAMYCYKDGIDASPEMIREAYNRPDGQRGADFFVADVLTWESPAVYDLIYSQRCLINLPDWPTQRKAIERILSWLRPNGLYLAVECSADGLSETNALRADVDLPPIAPPSHNRYLYDQEMIELGVHLWEDGVAWLADIEPIASTYAFLSRVVNARLAADAGEEPRYDAEVNKLALRLPSIGNIGQNVAWCFRRVSG